MSKFQIKQADDGQWKVVAPNGKEKTFPTHQEALNATKALITLARKFDEFGRRFAKLAEAAKRRKEANAGGEVRDDSPQV